MATANPEQTLMLLKPDALRHSLMGYVLTELSERHTGLCLAAAKVARLSRLLAEEHYAEHRQKVFFPSLLDYLAGRVHYPDEPRKRRLIALVFHGPDAIDRIRALAGPTSPAAARQERPGCIRALGTVVPVPDARGGVLCQRMENLLHSSANSADAELEVQLWFKPDEIPPLLRGYDTEVSDAHYYYKDGQLATAPVRGGACLAAPGDVAWKNDLAALRSLSQGQPASRSLGAVAAKYLLNQADEGDC